MSSVSSKLEKAKINFMFWFNFRVLVFFMIFSWFLHFPVKFHMVSEHWRRKSLDPLLRSLRFCFCDLESSSMATSAVTLPPSLAFLVSNFHSLVNIKLDGSNFLLWKTQVKNVLNANGFLGYVDGTVVCPSTQIRNSTGEMVTNLDFALWKLIDSQLLACLTASLSQTTLPYVLGFRHSFEVWHSLDTWYNSLSRTHVHELRSKLYSLTKTSSME